MKLARVVRIVVVTALMLAHPSSGAAQRPKVGLALSGGAARGFAHVGVLKVLEEAGVPIDCVSGNSMGAIIGGLYACGYSVAELESISVHVNWNELFSDAVGRNKLAMVHKRWDSRFAMTFPVEGWSVQLPSGLIAGQKISKMLSRLTLPVDEIDDFSQLPTPFVCVATDIVNGEVVVLSHGDLAESIRASMSVPTMFTPVVIDGRLLVDGGVTRNLPAAEVRDLGADIVIGVDVAEPLYKKGELNSMLRVMDQTIHFQIAGTSREQKKLCDILIVPESEKLSIEFDQAAYFIQRGEEAARSILPRLRALADSVRALGPVEERRIPERVDSVYVTAVSIEGLKDIPARVVESELMVKPPLWMSVQDIEDAIDQVYKYDFFERVEFSISPLGDGDQLDLKLVEKSRNILRAGLRYDSQSNLAVLCDLTLRNLGLQGSLMAFDVRLGLDVVGEVWYFTPVGRTLRSFGLSARVNTSWRRLNFYQDAFRAAVYRTTYTLGELMAGNIFATRVALQGGIRAEYIRTQLDSGVDLFPEQRDTMLPVFGSLRVDTIDRTVFPRSGLYVDLTAEATSTRAGSDVAVSRYYLDWHLRVPLHRTVSLFQTLYLGTTPVGDSPAPYLFTVGGMQHPFTWLGHPESFVGFQWQELTGPHVQTLGVGVQWQCYRVVYATARWNIGNAFQDWNGDVAWNAYEHGGGVTVGVNIPNLPIAFTMASSTRHDFLAQLTIGYWF